jgi:hypothetical protein
VNDDELREMIRASIARHLGRPAAKPHQTRLPFRAHASHVMLALTSGDDQGMCVIEPAVRCNHCGYCLSYGH